MIYLVCTCRDPAHQAPVRRLEQQDLAFRFTANGNEQPGIRSKPFRQPQSRDAFKREFMSVNEGRRLVLGPQRLKHMSCDTSHRRGETYTHRQAEIAVGE